jgi:hypothetical protein
MDSEVVLIHPVVAKMRQRAALLLLVLSLVQPGLSCVQCHAGCIEHDPSGKLRSPHFHVCCLHAFCCSDHRLFGRADGLITVRSCARVHDHDCDAIDLPISVVQSWTSDRRLDSFAQHAIDSTLPAVGFSPGAYVGSLSQRLSSVVVSPETRPVYLRLSALLI